LKDKAEILVPNGQVFRSEYLELDAPSVLRLRRFVRVPYRVQAPLTRRAVFARDDWTCQYCGAPAENLDHVVPRSKGGTHTWDNVVAACRRCNSRKENRLRARGPAGRVPLVARTPRARVGAVPLIVT
jgi:5-methylcytosine-specific restriction endonuclease McrA